MTILKYFYIPLLFILLFNAESIAQKRSKNPPCKGFNIEKSDAKAIAIADEVMEAIGGRKAWDKSRYFTWKFMSYRKITLDRYTGDALVHDLKSNTKIILNIRNATGKVLINDKELSDTSSQEFKKAISRGKKLVLNDSYWLLMPMKLKDSGVTLKYLNEAQTKNGTLADVLQLTFDNVGFSPENKYWVYVDKNTKLVTQWSFFRNANDEKPEYTDTWSDYQRFGKILLSTNRGRPEGGFSEVSVSKKINRKIFKKF